METLIGGVGLFDVFQGEITEMSFSVDGDTLYWNVTETGIDGHSEKRQIAASFSQYFKLSECNGLLYGASARWRSFRVLELEIRRIDAVSGARIIFRFTDNGLTLEADDTLVSVGGLGIWPKQTAPFRRI